MEAGIVNLHVYIGTLLGLQVRAERITIHIAKYMNKNTSFSAGSIITMYRYLLVIIGNATSTTKLDATCVAIAITMCCHSDYHGYIIDVIKGAFYISCLRLPSSGDH